MKLVILDRNGTINEEGAESVETPESWQPLPGALEAIAKLNHAGWHVVVAANQANLGRGLIEVATLNALHARMHKMLAVAGGRVDAVFYCPHAPSEACRCRKPAPGLFEQIGERYGFDLKGMPTVGDSEEDLVDGAAIGCQPHLVLTGRGAQYRGRALPASFPAGTHVHRDLAAFADFLTAAPEPARVSAARQP